MFEKILIKSGSSEAERFLYIPDLVDMMFYYGEVHVLVSQFELKQLLTKFGEDVLYELINTGRLIVHLCDQHVGASVYGELNSVGIFRHNFNSIHKLLYNYHKIVVDENYENNRFADRFSNVIKEYRYPDDISKSLYADIENEELLSRVTQVFISQYYPNYHDIEHIHVSAEPRNINNMLLYKIDWNLCVDELNTIHQQRGYYGSFSFPSILIALGETQLDCYLASELQAEMIANRRWANVYKLRMNECINRATGSKNNIDHFQEMAANDFLSPGQSFEAGLISPDDLLRDLNSKDSVKFREWLSKLPEGQPLTGELYKGIQNQNSNKGWVKASRFVIQIISGLISPLGGVATSLLDSFVGDRLVNGWNPSMFISDVLTKDQYKR